MHQKMTFPRLLCTGAFLLLTVCILKNPDLSLRYALTGLTLWFDKMIPVLLPFMILSGVMVRMNLTEGFSALLYPLIRPLFRVSRNVCYVMIMGFLCGFPMGAKCVVDLYTRGMLSKRESEYLLAFCNNIGPVYFCGFVLPLLGLERIAPCVFGMYGLPLLYGIVLRCTRFHDLGMRGESFPQEQTPHALELLEHLDASIFSSLQSITMLGGYMILFNLLNIVPHLLLSRAPRFLAPLLEITGGLQLLGTSAPLYSLLALPFGGLSCIAQTYSCLADTDLSIRSYVLHKLILTLLTALWYGLWRCVSPAGFLQ